MEELKQSLIFITVCWSMVEIYKVTVENAINAEDYDNFAILLAGFILSLAMFTS